MTKSVIGFSFHGEHYSAIIRVYEPEGRREYHVTILDRKLERILYGQHIIREKDGSLIVDEISGNQDLAELKLSIAGSLSGHLKIPCFMGEQCIAATTDDCSGWEHLHPMARHIDHRSLL